METKFIKMTLDRETGGGKTQTEIYVAISEIAAFEKEKGSESYKIILKRQIITDGGPNIRTNVWGSVAAKIIEPLLLK